MLVWGRALGPEEKYPMSPFQGYVLGKPRNPGLASLRAWATLCRHFVAKSHTYRRCATKPSSRVSFWLFVFTRFHSWFHYSVHRVPSVP